MELSGSALNRISSLLETQLGYVTQLGNYLSSVLQVRLPCDLMKVIYVLFCSQRGESSQPVEVAPSEDVTGEDGDNESSDSGIP